MPKSADSEEKNET